MSKRNDVHIPSKLVPADYTHVLSFAYGSDALPRGAGLPELHRLQATEKFFRKSTGGGGCDVCGAHFMNGDVFRHVPSGELIKVGWECALKIDSGLDHSGVMLELGRQKAENKREAWRAAKAIEANQFLVDNPGLTEALELDHHISRDLKEKLLQWGNLSQRQVALAFKLHDDASRPARPKVPVPVSDQRMEITGRIISIKISDYDPIPSSKMLVEVDTQEGAYRIYGTMPQGLDAQRGSHVRFAAKVKRSDRDESFGFFSRPTKAQVV